MQQHLRLAHFVTSLLTAETLQVKAKLDKLIPGHHQGTDNTQFGDKGYLGESATGDTSATAGKQGGLLHHSKGELFSLLVTVHCLR